MRRSLLGALICAGLVVAATANRGSSEPALAGRGDFYPMADGLITHVSAAEGRPQTVTVIDPGQRVMGVYHVDALMGEITLKSVRNFSWDLQMVEFNSGDPLPQDVRSGLDR